jgi:hypothetical protein
MGSIETVELMSRNGLTNLIQLRLGLDFRLYFLTKFWFMCLIVLAGNLILVCVFM